MDSRFAIGVTEDNGNWDRMRLEEREFNCIIGINNYLPYHSEIFGFRSKRIQITENLVDVSPNSGYGYPKTRVFCQQKTQNNFKTKKTNKKTAKTPTHPPKKNGSHQEFEDLHRMRSEGLGRIQEWRDSSAVVLVAKWRAMAEIVRLAGGLLGKNMEKLII